MPPVAKPPWRPGKPTTLVPLGNIDLATQWVPYARKVLADLSLQGDFRRKMITPAPGIVIHLETRGGIPRIIIEAGGNFWWWRIFWEDDGQGGTVSTIRAADIPEGVSVAGLISGALPTGYRSHELYRQAGKVGTGSGDTVLTKSGRSLRGFIYEQSRVRSIVVTGQDNDQPQQLQTFFTIDWVNDTTGQPQSPSELSSFAYLTEWAVLYGSSGTYRLMRGRYPTADDPSDFHSDVAADLSAVFNIPELPGPNGTAGMKTRGSGIFFGAWQGNGSFDPEFPPDPDAPPDRDFYLVSLVETTVEIDPGPPVRYQQAPVLRRRSIEDPNTDIMASSWLLEEWVQKGVSGDTPILSWVYEYQGKVFVIFQRYVEDFPDTTNKDRDWFFDQYVIDKVTGELLHTQLDCGIRIWAETDQGLYGYAQPRVTFTYDGSTRTAAHVLWALRKYEFGTGADALSLFIARDGNDEPIQLLSAETTYLFTPGSAPPGMGDINNRLILLQH